MLTSNSSRLISSNSNSKPTNSNRLISNKAINSKLISNPIIRLVLRALVCLQCHRSRQHPTAVLSSPS